MKKIKKATNCPIRMNREHILIRKIDLSYNLRGETRKKRFNQEATIPVAAITRRAKICYLSVVSAIFRPCLTLSLRANLRNKTVAKMVLVTMDSILKMQDPKIF